MTDIFTPLHSLVLFNFSSLKMLPKDVLFMKEEFINSLQLSDTLVPQQIFQNYLNDYSEV